jgi:peroxiredoxin
LDKKRRLIVRAGILIGFVAMIIYVLYSSIFNNDNGMVSRGDQAPDFQLQTLDGKTVRLSDYRGQGVFLNFWATYCPPCKKEMPYMQNQYEKFKDKGVTILAVDVGEPKLTVEKFVKRYGLTFPILLDEKEEVIDLYGVGAIPVTFLIDKNGKVVDRITASLTEEDIKEYMTQIMP